jgi:hypothetical protein
VLDASVTSWRVPRFLTLILIGPAHHHFVYLFPILRTFWNVLVCLISGFFWSGLERFSCGFLFGFWFLRSEHFLNSNFLKYKHFQFFTFFIWTFSNLEHFWNLNIFKIWMFFTFERFQNLKIFQSWTYFEIWTILKICLNIFFEIWTFLKFEHF